MRIPFVQNVRRGLATNSSSSHSLVYFTDPRPDHDNMTQDVSSLDTEFGWGQFKLTTRREKLMYALVTVLHREGLNTNWTGEGDVETAAPAVNEIIKGFPELQPFVAQAMNGYVDHQSLGNPTELFEAALDPRVEIWGGNDNDGSPFEYDEDWNELPPPGAERVERIR